MRPVDIDDIIHRLTNELAETTVQRDEWKRIAEDRGIELERLRADISQSRAAIEQLHAAVKTAQELAARRLMEVERLREVLTIPNITPDTTSSALFIRTLSEHEKGQPVNGQDLINALMWRVRNQKREIARLHATIGGES